MGRCTRLVSITKKCKTSKILKGPSIFFCSRGVSAVVGAVLMVIVSIAAMSLVYSNALLATNDFIEGSKTINCNVEVIFNEDKIFIRHAGGEPIKDYTLVIGDTIYNGPGLSFGDSHHYAYNNENVLLTSNNQILFSYNPPTSPPVFPDPEPEAGVFFNIWPVNGSTNKLSPLINLSWSYIDPDNLTVFYTLYYQLNTTGWQNIFTGCLNYSFVDMSNYDFNNFLRWYIVADNGTAIKTSPLFWFNRWWL